MHAVFDLFCVHISIKGTKKTNLKNTFSWTIWDLGFWDFGILGFFWDNRRILLALRSIFRGLFIPKSWDFYPRFVNYSKSQHFGIFSTHER